MGRDQKASTLKGYILRGSGGSIESLFGSLRVTRRIKVAAGYGLILLGMFLPLIPVVIASAIASSCGSKLDEAGPHPCILFGRDFGGILYAMGMMGWFGLLTFPTGFLTLVIFTAKIIKERKRELGL